VPSEHVLRLTEREQGRVYLDSKAILISATYPLISERAAFERECIVDS